MLFKKKKYLSTLIGFILVFMHYICHPPSILLRSIFPNTIRFKIEIFLLKEINYKLYFFQGKF